MKKWEKFTAIGAIGPDIFYFCQDWNNDILGPLSDELMLALATYYFIDTAKENDWEPLLVILDEANSQLADLLRFLIKLQKIWDDFVDGWNATIGPIVADIENLTDDLTGGVLSEFGVVLDELKLALKNACRGRAAHLRRHLQRLRTPACKRVSARSCSCGAT